MASTNDLLLIHIPDGIRTKDALLSLQQVESAKSRVVTIYYDNGIIRKHIPIYIHGSRFYQGLAQIMSDTAWDLLPYVSDHIPTKDKPKYSFIIDLSLDVYKKIYCSVFGDIRQP